MIFPSLLQLQRGITDLEDRKQKDLCTLRYRKKDELERGKSSEIDLEREEECGICFEMNSRVVLPNCSHSLCLKCYRDWYVFFLFVNTLSYYILWPTYKHFISLITFCSDSWATGPRIFVWFLYICFCWVHFSCTRKISTVKQVPPDHVVGVLLLPC